MSTEEVITMENRILEAAKQVFVRKGYEATKMGDVAAEAGIGRTALHYYYRTKEMLQRDPEHIYQSVLKDPARVEPIIHLRTQIQNEMEKGLLKKMPLIYTASTLVSLVVFPALVRKPFTAVFMDGDTEKYEAFLQGRIPFVTDIMIRLLTPDDHIQHK